MRLQFPKLNACRGVLGITALSAAAVLPACSSPFDWDADVDLRLVNMTLEELVVTEVSGEDPLEFTVRAVFSEPFRLEQRDRVAVSVRSPGGAEQEILLRPTLCFMPTAQFGASAGARYRCDRFSVVVHAHDQLEIIRPRVEALPGTLSEVRTCAQSGECHPPLPRLGSVRVEGDLFLAIRTAERWPEVKEARVSPLLFSTSGSPLERDRILSLNHELRGRVSLGQVAGEELEIIYLQPDGSSLRASLVVP